ncbi:MAG TPA: hypothetical protein VFT64_07355 [Rickettsiales bacterium]|nr:hypothetical protein [Rickettsiales bacterium]
MKAKNAKNKYSGQSTFTMMIGDEGAVLVQLQHGAVVRRLFAASPDPAQVRAIDEALNNSPNSPITVLFDIMDQSYVRQTLPPVSSFSVGKIISRRLAKDFSPDDIKGFVILDRDKAGRRDWNYMMVSLANTAILQKWMNFITERSNPFRGMGLLPMEAQNFMRALEKHFQRSKSKDSKPMEWQILVSHHKVGGFRQVVMRNGKLVFTRMALPFGESLPDVIAGNIEQEMINTLEYLKRLGLQDTALISITIICSEEIKQALDPKNIKAGEHHFLTPYEVANMLSLKDAAGDGDHFGDIVLSAFIAKQRKLILPLFTDYTRKLRNLSMFALYTKLGGALCALAVLGWIGSSAWSIFETKQAISDLEIKHHTLTESLNKIKVTAETLPKNVNLYSDIMTISQMFNKPQYDIIPFIEQLSTGISNTAMASSLHWVLQGVDGITKTTDSRTITSEVELKLITTPETNAQMRDAMKNLQDVVKKAMPTFNISYEDTSSVLSDTKELKTVIGDAGAAKEDTTQLQNAVLKMKIDGPIDEKKQPGRGPR